MRRSPRWIDVRAKPPPVDLKQLARSREKALQQAAREAHPHHAQLVGEQFAFNETPVSRYIRERRQEEADDPVLAAARAEARAEATRRR